MGTRRHGQEGALAPYENVVKCFCALVVPAKRSEDELFCIIFTTCRRQPPDPNRGSIRGPCWGNSFQTPNLPTPRKKTLRAPMFICHPTW